MGLYEIESSSSVFNVAEINANKPAASLPTKSGASDHLFVNNVRFLSMFAIVGMHAILAAAVVFGTIKPPYFYAIQPFKFGTIAFFLVSGFLFGERTGTFSSIAYFKRRLRKIFIPWLYWFLLFGSLVTSWHFLNAGSRAYNFFSAFTDWEVCLFDSSFWFVPNLLFGLAILLLLRRWLFCLLTGAILLLASAFYCVNIYGHWAYVGHTRAAFGFVFFFWLGAWCTQHYKFIEDTIRRISWPLMILAVLTAFGGSILEIHFLVLLGSEDPLNTLRFTNVIYSLAVVVAIMKLRTASWPRFMDVRSETFGIYLTHSIILAFLAKLLKCLAFRLPMSSTVREIVALALIPVSVLVGYTSAFLLVRLLLRYRFTRFTLGQNDRSSVLLKAS